MTMGKLRFTHVMLFFLLSTVISCNVQKNLAERLAVKKSDTAELRREFSSSLGGNEVRLIDWKTAVKTLNERNISIRRTKIRIEGIKKERDEQWKTWLPRIGAFANLQTSLSELSTLALSDLSIVATAPLNIPNPATERAAAFENALSYLQAVDSGELSYRRDITRLYEMFSAAERLKRDFSGIRDTETIDINSAIRGLEQSASQVEQMKRLSERLANILNMPGEQVYPSGNTRPKLDYADRIGKLKPGVNYGELGVRLSAYQLEGALLREKGIKLRRWPALSLSASVPPLFDSRNGVGDFETDRIFVFGGLNKSYDFIGSEAKSVETAEQNTQFVKENLRLKLDQEVRDWKRIQGRYQKISLRSKIARERLMRIRKGGDGVSASAALAAVREAQEMINSILELKERLDVEIWIWDESKWK